MLCSERFSNIQLTGNAFNFVTENVRLIAASWISFIPKHIAQSTRNLHLFEMFLFLFEEKNKQEATNSLTRAFLYVW